MGAAVIIIVFVVMTAGGFFIGNYKGRPVLGAVLGLLLGLIGWLIMAFVPKTHEKQVKDRVNELRVNDQAAQRAANLQREAEQAYASSAQRATSRPTEPDGWPSQDYPKENWTPPTPPQ